MIRIFSLSVLLIVGFGCNDNSFLGNSDSRETFASKGPGKEGVPGGPLTPEDADPDQAFDADSTPGSENPGNGVYDVDTDSNPLLNEIPNGDPPVDLSEEGDGGQGPDSGAPTAGSDEGDGGNAPKKLSFNCDRSTNRTILVGANVTGEDAILVGDDQKVTTSVKGEFCPKLSGGASVLFVVDVSGSMASKTNPAIPEGGSDPSVGGTCGRYNAIKGVVDTLKQKLGASADSVDMGLITWSTNIVANNGMAPLSQFETQSLQAQTLCAGSGFTNVAAAMTTATQALQNSPGQKVIYFITDGNPRTGITFPDEAANQAGLDSARGLKALDNLTLYTIYLGVDNSPDPASPWTYLQNLTEPDGKSRIAVNVKDAKDLPSELKKLAKIEIDANSGRASALVEPYPEKDIGLKIFDDAGSSPEEGEFRYVYQTQSMVLLGLRQKWVDNLVKVSAVATDGSEVTNHIIFRYCKVGPCGPPGPDPFANGQVGQPTDINVQTAPNGNLPINNDQGNTDNGVLDPLGN